MEQLLDYWQVFDKKIIPRAMKILCFLALVSFIAGAYSLYYGSIIWSDMHGSYQAFVAIWLPNMPYLIYWLALVVCSWKDWRIILWGIPLVTYKIFPVSSTYIYHYHTNMGSLYYPGQAFALVSVFTLILGSLLFLLYIIIFYKRHEQKILGLWLKIKNSRG